MAIELPREVDDLDRRLALLEDPAFAAHLVEENPSLYLRALAQRDKEAEKRTRWSAWLAGTAIVSLAAGLFVGQRHPIATTAPVPTPAHHSAQAKPRALVVPTHPLLRHLIIPAPVALVAPKPEIRHAQARVAAPLPQPKTLLKPAPVTERAVGANHARARSPGTRTGRSRRIRRRCWAIR